MNLPKRLSFVNGRAGEGFGETSLGPAAAAILCVIRGEEPERLERGKERERARIGVGSRHS